MTTPDRVLPRLAHGFRLQWEEAQGCHVLLYPEGMVKLNRSAGEILARCDGRTTLEHVVAQLETAFDTKGLDAEVAKFLELAAAQHWVELT
jgi:pyrroloquinoline quinone biosynthesis protein D